jgi:gamma-glutamyltranspeptidase/glutathione hydrolase
VLRGLEVSFEDGFAPAVLRELETRGHEIVATEKWDFGGAQLLYKTSDAYCAASDGRKDGQAVGF